MEKKSKTEQSKPVEEKKTIKNLDELIEILDEDQLRHVVGGRGGSWLNNER